MKKVEIKLSEGDFIWNASEKKKGIFHKDIDGNPFISYGKNYISFNVDYSIIERYMHQDNFQMFSLKSKVVYSLNRIVMTTGNVKGDRFEGINLFTGEKTYFLLDPKWVDITNDYHMTLSKYL
jgi:hypothetical protein